MQAFHRVLDHLPILRRGKNITYAIKDAALGAFAVFFTQSPSFLAYQQTMQRTRGRSNAEIFVSAHKSWGKFSGVW